MQSIETFCRYSVEVRGQNVRLFSKHTRKNKGGLHGLHDLHDLHDHAKAGKQDVVTFKASNLSPTIWGGPKNSSLSTIGNVPTDTYYHLRFIHFASCTRPTVFYIIISDGIWRLRYSCPKQ